jgi:mevalonate pyrophosphate decarboxylase
MLRNDDTLVKLTPHVSIARQGARGSYSSPFRFTIHTDTAYTNGIVASSCYVEELIKVWDVVLRLLAASNVHSVHLDWRNYGDGGLNNAPTTAAATSSASIVAAASVAALAPTDGDVSTTSVSALDGDATPTVGEKRKARP